MPTARRSSCSRRATSTRRRPRPQGELAEARPTSTSGDGLAARGDRRGQGPRERRRRPRSPRRRSGARSEEIAQAQARLVAAQARSTRRSSTRSGRRRSSTKGAISQAEATTRRSRAWTAVAQRDALQAGARRARERDAPRGHAQASARAPRGARQRRAPQGRVARRGHPGGARPGGRGEGQARADRVRHLDELTIRAPRASRVESLDLRPGRHPRAERTRRDAARGRPALRAHLRAGDADRRCIRVGQEVPITVDSFAEQARSRAWSSTSTTSASTRRATSQTADERADQVFATRVGLREGRTTCARAWRRSSRCPNDRRDRDAVPSRGRGASTSAGVTRKFGDFTALDDVNLAVHARDHLRPARPQRLGQVDAHPHPLRPARADLGHARPCSASTWRRRARRSAGASAT